MFRWQRGQIGPGSCQGIIRQAIGLRLIDFRAIEGEHTPTQVGLVALEDDDLTHTQAMIEQEAHEQRITLCQETSLRMFESVQQLQGNINRLCFLVSYSLCFPACIDIPRMLALNALHALNVSMGVYIQFASTKSQVAVCLDGG